MYLNESLLSPLTAARNRLAAILALSVSAATLLMPSLSAQETGAPAPLPSPPPPATQMPAPVVRPASPKQKPASADKSANPPAPLATKRVPAATGSAPPGSAPTGATTSTLSKAAPVHHATTPNTTTSSASGAALILASPGPFNRTTIFIDPAHGGTDTGARLTDSVTEKDISLQLAFKLRSLLSARGFTVVLSRDTDDATTQGTTNSPGTALTLDARAGMANRARPVACLLLHATGSGRGVHLYSSEMTPTSGEVNATPWLTAQGPWVAQSLKLQKSVGQAITRGAIPLVLSRASVRPVDSLTCPALVVELAPRDGDAGSITDDPYQQRVAQAIATALVFWQNTAQPPPRLIAPPSASSSSTSPVANSATSTGSTTPGAQP